MTDRYAPPGSDRYAPPGSAARLAAAERVVEAQALMRDYELGGSPVHALRGIDLAVVEGEMVAVRGRSGSGKTTLLNLLGGLDRPTSGSVWLEGREISAMSEAELVEVRRRHVAFVFQTFGLIPYLSAAENVEVPLRLLRADPSERDERVLQMLDLVGLAGRAKHRPFELSGGEQQRVAIARALAGSPRLLLADEPTGQLDSETGHRIMELMRSVMRGQQITVIVATHDPRILDVADRVLELRDGMLVRHDAATSPAPPSQSPA